MGDNLDRQSFFLMSGDSILIEFTVGSFSFEIQKIYKKNKHIFPLALTVNLSSETLGYWLNSRISPLGKRILKRIRSDARSRGPLGHLGLTLGLSLNDIFWVNDGSYNWKEVNLYENDLNPEIAELAFSLGMDAKSVIGSRSPEFSSGGNMRKCWFKRDGEIFLMKNDEPDADGMCQTTNEWFAAQIAETMGLRHVAYNLKYRNSITPVCECMSFTNIHIGFVPALIYFMANSINPNFYNIYTSSYGLHEYLAEIYGLEEYEDMMLFDAVVGNSDRHMLNFGMLYDNDTGKILNTAPIFDNGLSFNKDEACYCFDREEQAMLFVRPRHKQMLESLRFIELNQHHEVTVSEQAIGFMQKYIRDFAEKILVKVSW